MIGDTLDSRIAGLLLHAASLPVARRRELAILYRQRRARGEPAKLAAAAVAREARLPKNVLGIAIHGGVWECESCGRTAFRLRGPEYVYLDGQPASACCLQRGQVGDCRGEGAAAGGAG